MSKQPEFKAMAEAICHWWAYQNQIGRSHMIHEASLRYPLADFLTAYETMVKQVRLEVKHPLFKSKRIDVEVQGGKESSDRMFFELKISKKETGNEQGVEWQRIFDDVVRLAYLNQQQRHSCFFIMCGPTDEFLSYFIGVKQRLVKEGDRVTIRLNSDSSDDAQEITLGIYSSWFSFKVGGKASVPFVSINDQRGLNKFQKNYSYRDTEHEFFTDSIVIKTTCMALTPTVNRTHAAGIWKIEADL